MERELLALLIEVTSIGAAGRQLRKPIDVPRPGGKNKRRGQAQTQADTQRAFAQGVSVLAGSAKAVSR